MARVQAATKVTYSASSATALTIALTGVVTGNTLIGYCAVENDNQSFTISSVTDGTNTYTQRSGRANSTTEGTIGSIAHSIGVTGGSLTVSFNLTGVSGSNRYAVLGLEEWSDIASEDTYDVNELTNITSADASAGPITTSRADAIIVGMAALSEIADTNNTFSSPSSWTNSYREVDNATYRGMDAGYWIPGSVQTTYTAQWSHDNYSGEDGVGVIVAFLPPAVDQSAFRWGLDDNTESTHGWDEAENTNTTDTDNQTKLLRTQLEATDNPASVAYTLRYQKNGSGGYVAVPVGASSDVVDSPSTDSGTLSGSNTEASSWTTVAVPAYASGSLVIIGIAWDDSTNTTDVTEPAGPNSETILEVNATPSTDSSTETRCKVWYYISTASYAGGNFTFTPSATESWQAVSYAIPSGEFDGTTPIGATNTNNGGTASTNIQHGAFSAGASDGGGRLFCFASADADPQTVASGFTRIRTQDLGAVTGGLYSRNTVVSDSESFSATTFATIAGDSFASVSFVVRPYVQTNEVYVNTSGNIAAGGEATTARLSVPGGKSFTTGRRWDDENDTDSTDIANNNYTELEWAVALSSAPATDDYFEFRVYRGSNALTAYDYTPKWTVGTAGISGTTTTTNANDTSSITGTLLFTGTTATTNVNDTSSISGSLGTPITGTIAYTNTDDASAITGSLTVSGTISYTNLDDTSSVSGVLNVTGTIAQSNIDDTSSISGSVGTNITGTIAYTNLNDTSSIAGAITITGTISQLNVDDAGNITGILVFTGTTTTTNANDTMSASGTLGAIEPEFTWMSTKFPKKQQYGNRYTIH